MQILPLNALIDVPWKNGGGTTRSIARGMRRDHVVWTISRADVAQDGAFSDFSGMMRVLTVVSGGAMTLDTTSTSLEANLWEPVRFEGALKVHSRLQDGPLTDLNLMFDPTLCEGDVITHRGPLDQIARRPMQGILAFHVLSGSPMINAARLSTGDTACLDHSDATLTLADGDALLEIRLTYLDQSDAIRLCMADR